MARKSPNRLCRVREQDRRRLPLMTLLVVLLLPEPWEWPPTALLLEPRRELLPGPPKGLLPEP